MALITVLQIVHLIGMSLAVGAATAKTFLVVKCRREAAFLPSYLHVAPVMTRHIQAGMIMVTLSGLVWLIIGYDIGPRLIVKLILVGFIWILGPVIDKLIEPKLRKLSPAGIEAPSGEFIRVLRQYLAFETAATLLFYAIIILWMTR